MVCRISLFNSLITSVKNAPVHSPQRRVSYWAYQRSLHALRTCIGRCRTWRYWFLSSTRQVPGCRRLIHLPRRGSNDHLSRATSALTSRTASVANIDPEGPAGLQIIMENPGKKTESVTLRQRKTREVVGEHENEGRSSNHEEAERLSTNITGSSVSSGMNEI